MLKSVVFVVLVLISTGASAWDWNGDAVGQKLDTEARHLLTTQNVCGVILRADYMKDLYAKIDRHFDKSLGYQLFLRRSVVSSNGEYLTSTEDAEIASECKTRVQELRKQKLIVE